MADSLIRIAVVGHTNTGKTSLLRTLTRDTRFGEVADSPGTTRHVEGARLRIEGGDALEWFDTPGMEDSISLLEYLERLEAPGERLDGPARVRRFLTRRKLTAATNRKRACWPRCWTATRRSTSSTRATRCWASTATNSTSWPPAAGPAASAELRQRAAASRRRLARGAGPAGAARGGGIRHGGARAGWRAAAVRPTRRAAGPPRRRADAPVRRARAAAPGAPRRRLRAAGRPADRRGRAAPVQPQ